MKKNLSLEKQIYLCKYHNIDTLGLSKCEVKGILDDLKANGLYEKYKNMSEEEYEKKIKGEKRMEKLNKNESIQSQENNLLSLNSFLFEQLKKLNSDTLTQDQLDNELRISKQVVSVSQTIINNANLLLQAKKHFDQTGESSSDIAPLLSLGDKND